MNVRRSNPLNRLYRLWIELGGKATYENNEYNEYKDNLCHFMRVVLLWVWFRWLFKRRYMFTYIKGGIYISPFLLGLIAFSFGVLTSLVVMFHFVRILLLGTTALFLFMYVGAVISESDWGKKIMAQHRNVQRDRANRWRPRLDRWIEAFELFKDWLYAKKMRVCPQIKVEL